MNSEWKIHVGNVVTTLMAAAIGAVITWVVKLDDRVFTLASTAAMRVDVMALEKRIDNKFDVLIQKIETLRSDLDRSLASQNVNRTKVGSDR